VRAEIVAGGQPDVGTVVRRLRSQIPAGRSVSEQVAEIVAAVRTGGDRVVLDYASRFDAGGATIRSLIVDDDVVADALDRLDTDVRNGLELAIENVRAVALAGLVDDRLVSVDGASVAIREAAVDSAAVYAPSGRAPYPSSVVMGVITARAAGVGEIAVCAPPGRDGEIDPVILAACGLTGADLVYRMGGAHAIAALAYGSESVRAVDVIVGPGGLWVQEAKRQVSGVVAIDGFAGPSDLLVIADAGSRPEPISLDLLAQAEHGPGTLVVAASRSRQLLDELAKRLAAGPETGAVAWLIELADEHGALGLAQAFAPEHLQLIGPEAESLAPYVTHAGCVFVGAAAGTAFGDYIAGSNHILPTEGAARFSSALSVRSFRRTFTEVRVLDAGRLARAAAPVARAEGFGFHAQSMEIRENRRSATDLEDT
jgi:histidinol dehydrogenase